MGNRGESDSNYKRANRIEWILKIQRPRILGALNFSCLLSTDVSSTDSCQCSAIFDMPLGTIIPNLDT